MTFKSAWLGVLCGGFLLFTTTSAVAQAAPTSVSLEPSKKVIEDAAGEGCDGVSPVIRRCADQGNDAAARDAARHSDDTLTQSRARTKEAFDRRDRQVRDDALQGNAPASSTTGAQRLGGVEVTGKGDNTTGVESSIQKALTPPPVQSNGDGTTSRYAPNGSRYDCIEKCVGPACCVEVRSMPNPARDTNSINGH